VVKKPPKAAYRSDLDGGPGAKQIVKARLKTALLVGSTLWCLSIIVAPAVSLSWLYQFFATICHQNPERSWQIFGKSLPVCIRCASIYFAFTAALWFGMKANVRWLRIAVCLMLAEFVVARVVIDAAILRSISGILLGLTAAPFVKQGVEEICDFL
jgi:uncharacterized membrane protein